MTASEIDRLVRANADLREERDRLEELVCELVEEKRGLRDRADSWERWCREAWDEYDQSPDFGLDDDQDQDQEQEQEQDIIKALDEDRLDGYRVECATLRSKIRQLEAQAKCHQTRQEAQREDLGGDGYQDPKSPGKTQGGAARAVACGDFAWSETEKPFCYACRVTTKPQDEDQDNDQGED